MNQANLLGSDYPTLPLAEAALSLHQWDVALPLFYQAARNAALEPLTQLSLARALVTAAENQYQYKVLHAAKHAPGEDRVNEVAYQQFQKAILSANRMSSAPEITRWHHRGEAIFNPGPQTAGLVANGSTNPHDVAAQVRILAQMQEKATAAEVADTAEPAADPAVLFQEALALLETHPEKALSIAKTISNQQPEHPIHQALLAYAAEAAGDLETASQAMGTALSIWPNEPEWHAAAARLCASQGEMVQSLDHWKKAYDLEPESCEYACRLGKAYFETGDSQQAIQILEQATQLDTNRLEPWLTLAHAYSAAGNYPQATQCAERAISLSPNDVTPVVLSGEIALESGQISLAAERAQVALTLDGRNPQAILLQARAQKAMGHPADALNTLESALPSLEDAFSLRLERARLIRQLRGLEPALEALQDIVQHYPEEAASLTLLAEAQAEAGQRDAAAKSAQAALLLEPNQASLHLLLGRIQRGTGQLDQAIHHLAEAIRLSPNEMEAYLELGRAHQERREYTQAIKVYQQAIQLAPTDARLYYQSGLAQKDSKDYLAAETMLRRAADLAPEDLNIRRQLGAIIALNLVHHPQEASNQQ